MRLSTLLPMAGIVVFGACAALGLGLEPERSAQLRLDRGLDALDAGRYTAAFDDLAWVYIHCAGYRAGDDALAALGALELDPRNPNARPDVGAVLLGRLIRETPDRASRSLAETTFLTSLALGARHPDPASDSADAESIGPEPAGAPPDPHLAALTPAPGEGSVRDCGPRVRAERDSTFRSLPRLPGPSMASLLSSAEAARDAAAARVDSLDLLLATTREQLTATREELERIRKTLEP